MPSMFSRTRPSFHPGMLVRIVGPSPMSTLPEYLHIRARRYIRPNGMPTKRWVYDGAKITAPHGVMRISTYTWSVSEHDLKLLPSV